MANKKKQDEALAAVQAQTEENGLERHIVAPAHILRRQLCHRGRRGGKAEL